MSKRKIDVAEEVMKKINKGEVKMRPKWFFVLGSIALIAGVFGTFLMSSFLISLVSFSLRTHGPMGKYRFYELLTSFPWWALIFAVFGFVLGIWLLKKFDFSYKKNFVYIILIIAVAIVASGMITDKLELDRVWTTKEGIMKKMYQRYDGRGRVLPWRSQDNFVPGSGRVWKKGIQ